MDCSPPRTPLAYLITFCSYGTWLHGDERGSTDRFHNMPNSAHIPPGAPWQEYRRRTLPRPPVSLDAPRRRAAEAAVRETCEIRG
jgi:hypothetical protein